MTFPVTTLRQVEGPATRKDAAHSVRGIPSPADEGSDPSTNTSEPYLEPYLDPGSPYAVPRSPYTVEPGDRRWEPVAELHLPLDVLVVSRIIEELVADVAANGHVLVATTDEESTDVLRLGFWRTVEAERR